MGLAAPKNRIKLSHDPNNTKWTRDTQSFGHKIMASQGWTPGDHLGVQGSAHSEFHTDANFSHIRVTIKDDNLGLGAKIGSGVGHGECTGLDAFQNLLGRLNGRDEAEIEREQKSKDDLKRAIYAEQRWGSIRFVRGGLLVGDKIQDLIEDEKERVRKLKGERSSSESESSEEESEEETPLEEKRISKKRKLEDSEGAVPEVVAVKVKRAKKSKVEQHEKVKNKKAKKTRSSSVSDIEVTESLSEVRLSKKEKKAKKQGTSEADSDTSEDQEAKRIRKQEKKKRKEEKRLRKEQGKAALQESTKDSKSKTKKDKKKDKDKSGSRDTSRVTTIENTPVASGTSTPVMGGRHAVRARNIAQKRLAAMDVAGLNQIFMIKS